ncbi:response regulator transcription factor [Caulobacter sp. DWR1-3-2b1]|uniref:response regulator transcription factor n=1 Tax=Caulobacter sp. DWR1-3-2b1 TaxID=2804670 RepID=UPI003CE6C8B2
MSKAASLIYVADDDPDILELISIVLTRGGFEVVGFETADALMAALAVRTPAAALLDVRIPGQSGLDALKAIKDDSATAHIPVLMLTGDGRLDRIVQAMQLGAAGYVMKPFDGAQLVERVRSLLL